MRSNQNVLSLLKQNKLKLVNILINKLSSVKQISPSTSILTLKSLFLVYNYFIIRFIKIGALTQTKNMKLTKLVEQTFSIILLFLQYNSLFLKNIKAK